MSKTEEVAEDLVHRIADAVIANLAMIVGSTIELGECTVTRFESRPAATGSVHLSFRLKFERGKEVKWGYLLLPLRQAVASACSMLMMPLSSVNEICASGRLDESMKDAMLEIGNMLGSAVRQGYQENKSKWNATFGGCQGVRDGVPPWLPNADEHPLWALEGSATWTGGDVFRLLLALPAL